MVGFIPIPFQRIHLSWEVGDEPEKSMEDLSPADGYLGIGDLAGLLELF